MRKRIYMGGYLLIILMACFLLKHYAAWICIAASLALMMLMKNGKPSVLAPAALPVTEKGLPMVSKNWCDECEIMENRLRDSEQIFDSLFDHNPNAISVFDQRGNFVRVNKSMEQMLGYSAAEIIGLPFMSFVAQEHILVTLQSLEHVRKGNSKTFETAINHRTGYRVDLHSTLLSIVADQTANGCILIGQDITERKRVDEQVRYLAYYDDMTGLPNRQLFKDHLNEALKAMKSVSSNLAVFYLDIDQFKLINDSFGRDYGNMLLMQLAERFTRCITDNDFLARSEGDEFAFYYTHVDEKKDVLALVASIIRILEQPFVFAQVELHITASIGVAISSNEEEDAETLMKYADIALDRTKEKGRNDFQIYNTDMKSMSINRLKLENDLRKALLHDEFELYYQPQMDIESSRIVGVEALIRWNHPERGMVSPGDFIPLAEESGLIVPIGEWVLKAACRQNKAWQDQGLPPIPISVNLSMRQFYQHNLKDKINEVLYQTGLEPHYLELEITESMTINVDSAIQSLLELKDLGVHVSIDDFGTGYSSLYYLKKFPIDKLKIDRSFVRDIMSDPNDAAIVATIIAMTHHLNLKVIAEGVETEDQLHFLHQNHCNEIQGFWFSPPVNSTQMEKLFSRGG